MFKSSRNKIKIGGYKSEEQKSVLQTTEKLCKTEKSYQII